MNLFNNASNAGMNFDDQWIRLAQSATAKQPRTLFLRQPITHEVTNEFIAQLLYLEGENPDAAIQLHIQTEAGSVAAGLAIYDMIRSLCAPIHTRCLSVADGIGSLLLAIGAPGHRSAQPYARIRFAQPDTSFSGGTAYEIEAAAREVFRQRHRLYELYAEATGQPIERITEASARRTFLSATDALAYGLIDYIIRPGVQK
ncbi:ATP-dependent Clp protease proteolytic subunit [Cyanobacteria bacterium FACHB-63]|nr:ATP-dependent Clp protease proteolytic subunit [Cyanobacteria bacterium FACHB-63]